jgi:hypothetical protein
VNATHSWPFPARTVSSPLGVLTDGRCPLARSSRRGRSDRGPQARRVPMSSRSSQPPSWAAPERRRARLASGRDRSRSPSARSTASPSSRPVGRVPGGEGDMLVWCHVWSTVPCRRDVAATLTGGWGRGGDVVWGSLGSERCRPKRRRPLAPGELLADDRSSASDEFRRCCRPCYETGTPDWRKVHG